MLTKTQKNDAVADLGEKFSRATSVFQTNTSRRTVWTVLPIDPFSKQSLFICAQNTERGIREPPSCMHDPS